MVPKNLSSNYKFGAKRASMSLLTSNYMRIHILGDAKIHMNPSMWLKGHEGAKKEHKYQN